MPFPNRYFLPTAGLRPRKHRGGRLAVDREPVAFLKLIVTKKAALNSDRGHENACIVRHGNILACIIVMGQVWQTS